MTYPQLVRSLHRAVVARDVEHVVEYGRLERECSGLPLRVVVRGERPKLAHVGKTKGA